jgi:hypothetical protein
MNVSCSIFFNFLRGSDRWNILQLEKSIIKIIQSDQQENKSRVLPNLLFYRNVSLSLIVHIHSRFIGCLPLEKSVTY